MPAPLRLIQLPGLTPYREMLQRQRETRDAVERGDAPNTLFLLEHTPVMTLGRKAHREHLLCSPAHLADQGIDIIEVDRGGDVTYHGPGQLVAYPILRLEEWQPSVGWYIRRLEDVLITTLAHWGITAERFPPYTGVWTRGAKIAAIGIGIHKWISFHGVALNVQPNMDHFRLIVPCGIGDHPVTSIAQFHETPPSIVETMDIFAATFADVFQVETTCDFAQRESHPSH